MPTDEQAEVKVYGPLVSHEYPCMVRGCGRHAVLDTSSGLYGPCAYHVALVKVQWRRWYRRLLRRNAMPEAKVVAE